MRRAKREEAARAGAPKGVVKEADLGSMTASALKLIAADTAQPGAVRVAAHRAVLDYVSKTRSLEDADRTLDAQTVARLRAWARERIPVELGEPEPTAQSLEDADDAQGQEGVAQGEA